MVGITRSKELFSNSPPFFYYTIITILLSILPSFCVWNGLAGMIPHTGTWKFVHGPSKGRRSCCWSCWCWFEGPCVCITTCNFIRKALTTACSSLSTETIKAFYTLTESTVGIQSVPTMKDAQRLFRSINQMKTHQRDGYCNGVWMLPSTLQNTLPGWSDQSDLAKKVRLLTVAALNFKPLWFLSWALGKWGK